MSARLPIRTLLFGAAALALGSGTFLLAQTGPERTNPPGGAMAASVDMVKILVATRPLVIGTLVKPGDLAWRDWPKVALDAAYISDHSAKRGSFTGSIARSSIEPGEPITAGRLAAIGAGSALAAITQPGSRAVSINLTPTSGVSGLIVPGDRVDIILTYALPRPADGSGGGMERHAAATILSGIRVLAVDQRLSAATTDSKEIHNASLEVTAKQSEVLALAAELGKLSVSLRGLGPAVDTGSVMENIGTLDYQVGRYLPGLRSSAASHPHPSGPRPKPAGSSATVEFHGGKAGAEVAAR